MAVPKKRTSYSRRNMRRANHYLSPVFASTCQNCGSPTLSHHACQKCGYYRGKPVLTAIIQKRSQRAERKIEQANQEQKMPSLL